MGTGGKVALGCGIALLVGIVAVVLTVGAGVFWVKGKAEQVAAEQKQIQDFQTEANKNTFVEPADGVIAEPQLLKFIEVRKRVHDVYAKHEDAIRAMKDKKEGDFGDVRKAFAVMNELRLAQAKAQAEQGMSDGEYGFLVRQVYKTSWAAEVAESSGGKSVSQAAGEAYGQAAEQMRKAAEATEGKDEASREALEKGMKDLEDQAEDVREAATSLDVPPANIALFRKHEADIKKYAMSGLEWIGL